MVNEGAMASNEKVLEIPMPPPLWRSWMVWSIAAVVYLAAFYIRVAPAVMTTELMRDFHIAGTDLGHLSAFYYYAYVLMQIPIGILVDSWGARRLLVAGSILAAAGTFLFSSTDSFAIACTGRAITGAATAVGWVVTLKLATHWFPSRIFATLSGLGLLIGNIGALFAQVPLRMLVESFGWRSVGVASAIFIFSMGLLALAAVKDDPSQAGFASYAPAALQQKRKQTQSSGSFVRIFTYTNTWLIFFAQGGFVGAILSFTGLWGLPFLRARFGLPPTSTAWVSSLMIVCWASSSLFCGYMSDRIGRRKPIYVGGAGLAAVGWLVMFYLPGLPLAGFIAVAALTSFAAGSVILGFAYAKESVPIAFLGTIGGLINAGNMIGPTILQPSIGWVLDRQWDGQVANGAHVYSVAAFQTAFALIAGWAVLTCILASLTRETNCKQSA